jgi:murein DD-endopeptidase MepM/ murein hydrolase activator NlpD
LHPRLKCAKTVSVSRWAVFAGLGAMALLLVATSSVVTYFVTSRYVSERLLAAFSPIGVFATGDTPIEALVDTDAAYMRVGVGQDVAEAPGTPDPSIYDRQSAFLRRNLDALAEKLGQVQARLMRLDALGERVATMAGVEVRPAVAGTGEPAGKPGESGEARSQVAGGKVEHTQPTPAPTPSAETMGQGGPLLPDHGMLTVEELALAIDEVARTLEERADQLNLIESEFLFQRAASRLVPTAQPLASGYMASRFGRRVDPLNGRRARHEGLDFAAPRGTPILAAGPGVVVFAGWHPAYGNQVDIDHGDGLVTRYAHARKLFVKAGDIVHQGDKIAEVGSTGRSTGPHLHFEVRIDDVPHDPMKFLGNPVAFERARKTLSASN